MPKYAVIVIGGEVLTNPPRKSFCPHTGRETTPEYKPKVMTSEGTKFLVLEEEWVEGTGTSHYDLENLPDDTRTWNSFESASKFACRWKGHPWWVRPIGYKIIEVEPRYKQVRTGYKAKRGDI